VAGVELASAAVRVVVGHSESGRFRVTGVGHAPLPANAMSGGYIADRRAVGAALVTAFAGAERAVHAERIVVAIDGDDVRTFHDSTTFERDDQRAAVSPGEAVKAIRLAREAAARSARDLAGDDPALRGIATAELRSDVGGFILDGRRLGSPVGDRGQRLEVRTDVALAPLVQAGGVTGTRVFAIGRDGLIARQAAGDAAVWAQCVVATVRSLGLEQPGRWYAAGLPTELGRLPVALAAAASAERGSSVEVLPLRISLVPRVVADATLSADDLVAAGAAALGADAYA